MGKSTRSLIFKLSGSVLILYLLFRFIDIDTSGFINIVKNIHIPFYLLSLSGVVIVLAVKSYRWHWIIRGEGYYYPLTKSFAAYMASFTIGLVTPGRIGEIARLYYLRESVDMEFLPSFRTIVTDRIFDLGVLVMLSFAGLILYSQIGIGSPYVAVLIGVVVFFAGLLLTAWIISQLMKKPGIAKMTLPRFLHDCLRQAVHGKATMLWLITLLAYLIYYGAIWLIFKSLGMNMPIVDVAIILSIVGLATLLPISFAGFGTREFSLVYLLGFYGISAETALSFSILQFGAFFLWGGIIGLVFWVLMPISMDELKKDAVVIKKMISRKNQ
ncbi:MAG: lysylphosphatidylglycerol synthase transmembrane domain-containing protein [Bacteroidales bacterium]|nr:lysylphosphatidylglycerol synthase transmembrane domain-containing protein [Bacteroidales bacterium]